MTKFSLSGLIGYLQGKGWKVQLNEAADSEDETFIVNEEDEEDDEEELTPEEMMKKKKKKGMMMENAEDDTVISEEELQSLKGLAQVLAKNSKLLEAFQNGSLEKALSTVPAAAELVQNAQAQSKAEKEQLLASIKANSSNIYTDEELNAMTNPVLVKLNAQMNVSYAGLGGGSFIQNAEQPLVIHPVLLAQPEVKEA